MTDNPRVKLFQKILAVQKVLQPLEKSGYNAYFKYEYTTAADVLLPVKEACNQFGLILVSGTVDSKIEPGKAWATVQVTVYDSETGESISASCPSYAEDSKGDKAIFKALTNGLKYGVRSLFVLPSEDDSERSPANTSATATNGRPNQPTVNRLQSSDSLAFETREFKTATHKTVNTLQSDEPTSTNGKHPASVPRPPQNQNQAPPNLTAVEGEGVTAALIEATTREMQRLEWSVNQGQRFLEVNFGVRSRKHLTAGQLHQFLDFLRSLPTPERIPVPS